MALAVFIVMFVGVTAVVILEWIFTGIKLVMSSAEIGAQQACDANLLG